MYVCLYVRVCVSVPKIAVDVTPSETTRASHFLISCNRCVAYVRTFELGAPFTQSREIMHVCRSDKNM